MSGLETDGSADQTSEDGHSEPQRSQNRLWIERVARALRFDELAARVFDRPDLAPFLLLGTVLMFDFGVLSSLQYLLRGFHPFLVNPFAVVIPAGVLFGAWAARRLRDGYEAAVAEILEGDGTEQIPTPLARRWRAVLRLDGTRVTDTNANAVLRELVSDRLRVALLLLGWTYHASWVLFNPDAQEFIFQVHGPVIGPVKMFLLIPLVYYVVAVDFAATYLGILVLAPLKLRETGFIDLQDPLGYGKLKPLGNLVKSATLYYFAAISAYVALLGFSDYIARTGGSFPRVEVVNTFGVGVGITFGVVLFVLPIIVIHGHMKHAKHEKIRRLAEEVADGGPDDDGMMFPDTSVPDNIDDGHDYIQYFIKIRKVENTHEYPIDVSHLQEIALAALVPYIAHVTVTFLLTHLSSGGGH